MSYSPGEEGNGRRRRDGGNANPEAVGKEYIGAAPESYETVPHCSASQSGRALLSFLLPARLRSLISQTCTLLQAILAYICLISLDHLARCLRGSRHITSLDFDFRSTRYGQLAGDDVGHVQACPLLYFRSQNTRIANK